MMQKELLTPLTAEVGEHIGFELGAKMIKSFQDQNPDAETAHFVGREIIEKILAQPGCMGIQMYNALNENNEKTLVFVGLDKKGRQILEFTEVNPLGEIVEKEGIVADRFVPIRDDDTPISSSWWQ